jgi:hypothetical protein
MIAPFRKSSAARLTRGFSKFLKFFFAGQPQAGFGKGPNFKISFLIGTSFFEIGGAVDADVAGGFDNFDFFDEEVFAMLNEGGVGFDSDCGLGGSIFERHGDFDGRGVGVASDQIETEG